MWVFGVSLNLHSFSELTTAQVNHDKKFKDVSKITHFDFSENDNVIVETEAEIETNFDWFIADICTTIFNLDLITDAAKSKEFSRKYFNKSVPFYDLYCKWKFDLV